MKTSHKLISAFLGTIILSNSLLAGPTESPAIPTLINYQGYLTDDSNIPLGGNGTNYDMEFRLYSSGTGGTPLWGEKQTATIAEGQFSVLLGNGAEIDQTIDHKDLDLLFGPGGTAVDTGEVFLGITVNEVGQTAATEFTPRQQLVANPFALRAKSADVAQSVVAGALSSSAFAAASITGGAAGPIVDDSITASDIAPGGVGASEIANNAVGPTEIATNAVGASEIAANAVDASEIATNAVGASEIAANAVGASEIAANAVGASEIAANAVGASEIADGAIESSHLNSSIGVWQADGSNVYRNEGRVGIGVSNPAANLHIASTGDVNVLLEADTDNTDESHQPQLKFSQDGGLMTAKIGYFESSNNFRIYVDLVNNNRNEQGNIIIGNGNDKVTVDGTFVNSSDRRLKEDIAPVETHAVLERLTKVPISSWKFKASVERRHVGPMAQDFHAAFDDLLTLNSDDTTIAPLDQAGIAFASIQALNDLVNDKDEEIAELETRLQKIEALVGTLTLQKKSIEVE